MTLVFFGGGGGGGGVRRLKYCVSCYKTQGAFSIGAVIYGVVVGVV